MPSSAFEILLAYLSLTSLGFPYIIFSHFSLQFLVVKMYYFISGGRDFYTFILSHNRALQDLLHIVSFTIKLQTLCSEANLFCP